jgi:drug/metabolite transporter (DMT)-like permease
MANESQVMQPFEVSNDVSKPTFIIGLLLATFGAVLFSSKGILIKYAYGYDLTTDIVVLYRMVLALPVFAFVVFRAVKRRGIKRLPSSDILRLLFCGIFGYYLASWLSFYSLHFISVQLERIILFSYPALVVLGTALINKQMPTPRMMIAAFLTYIGVLVIFGHEWSAPISSEIKRTVPYGALMVGLAAVFFAASVLASKKLITKYGSAFYTGSTMAISAFAIVIHTIVFALINQESALVIPGNDAVVVLVLLAIVGTIVPAFMISEAIARIGTERTAISGTVGPIATSLIAIVLLDESFTLFHLAALVLCSVGIILIAKKPQSSN